jgi:hypothetical protein
MTLQCATAYSFDKHDVYNFTEQALVDALYLLNFNSSPD